MQLARNKITYLMIINILDTYAYIKMSIIHNAPNYQSSMYSLRDDGHVY